MLVMLSILFEIERIDYEKSIENLLPHIVEKCKGREKQSELYKFIAKLGPDAVPVAKKIMKYLDQTARDQIIIALIEPYCDRLVQAANDRLEKMLGGKTVVIGGFTGEDLPGSRLILGATQVEINYEALVNSPLFSGNILGGAVKFAIQMASPATIEKKAINILTSDLVKPKILSALSDALQKTGLVATLQDMTIREETDKDNPGNTKKDEGLLPDSIEDRLMDAVIAWMKDNGNTDP